MATEPLTREPVTQTEILLDVVQQLSLESDIERLGRKIIQAARELTDGDFAAVALVDENDPTALRYRWFSGLPETIDEETLRAPFRGGAGAGGQAGLQGQPILIEDYTGFPDALPAYLTLGVKSAAAAPIRVRGEVVGALSVGSLLRTRHFARAHLPLLELIARQLGVGLERERLIHELLIAKEHFQTLFERAPDTFIVFDDEGRVVEANQQIEGLTGYWRSAFTGQHLGDLRLLSPADVERFENHLSQALSGTRAGPDEFELTTREGESRPIELRTLPLFSEGHRRAVGIARDIAHQRKIVDQMEVARQQQAILNRLLHIGLEEGDLPEKLGRCLKEVLDADWMALNPRGGIFLFDDKTRKLHLTVHYNFAQELQQSCARVAAGHCLCGRAASTREIQFAECLDPRHEIRYPGITEHGHYNVPLTCNGKVLGVLVLYLDHGHTKTPREIDFLSSVGSTLAGIILRAQADQALRDSEARYALAVRATSDGVWDWDITTNQVYYSPRWKAMLGLRQASQTSTLSAWYRRIHPKDLGGFREALESELFEQGKDLLEYEMRLRHRDGAYRWISCRGLAVRDTRGSVTRIIGSITDITERKTAEERLRFEALHDALTGLPNRGHLIQRLSRAMDRARSGPGGLAALLFLDLDRFKIINDSLGHLLGDRVLQETSRRLQDCVGLPSTIARLGGDEFVILLEYVDDQAAVEQVVHRIHQALDPHMEIEGHRAFTNASIGIVFIGDSYTQAEDILRDADTAMFHAKRCGGRQHVVFQPDMREGAIHRFSLETELRKALDHDEITLHYQPIVRLEDGALAGFEALARWDHPRRGLIAPGEFIPVAEETGLIQTLGRQVLRKACQQMLLWCTRCGERAPCYVSVNLSPRQLPDPKLYDTIVDTLAETGLSPEQLRLEFTESAIMENVGIAAELMARLKAAGLRLCMDDFGTGYSSLSYLHGFPLDVLKIDRSFVQRMGQNRRFHELVRIIVSMADIFGLEVVAEGIEEASQVTSLRTTGCVYGQGYLFARPLSADAATQWLAQAQIAPVSSAQ